MSCEIKIAKIFKPGFNHVKHRARNLKCQYFNKAQTFSYFSTNNKTGPIKDNIVKKSARGLLDFVKEEVFDIKGKKKAGKFYRKIDMDKFRKEQLEKMNTTVHTLVVTKPKLTFWDKLKGKSKETPTYAKYKGYHNQFEKYKKTNKFFGIIKENMEKLSEKRSDFRDAMEVTQNPFILKARNIGDKMFSESNTSYALRIITEIEPDFMPFEFLAELRMHIIPVILEAQFKGDLEFLEMVCEERAFEMMKSEVKSYTQNGFRRKGQLVSISDSDFKDAQVKKGTPVLNFNFCAKYLETSVKVTKDEKGKEKEEDKTYQLQNVHYTFTMTPDRNCPIFGWKLVEYQFFKILELESS